MIRCYFHPYSGIYILILPSLIIYIPDVNVCVLYYRVYDEYYNYIIITLLLFYILLIIPILYIY